MFKSPYRTYPAGWRRSGRHVGTLLQSPDRTYPAGWARSGRHVGTMVNSPYRTYPAGWARSGHDLDVMLALCLTRQIAPTPRVGHDRGGSRCQDRALKRRISPNGEKQLQKLMFKERIKKNKCTSHFQKNSREQRDVKAAFA